MLEGHREPRTNARYERLAKRFPAMVKELRRKGVTPQLLWEEYMRSHEPSVLRRLRGPTPVITPHETDQTHLEAA